MKKMSAAARPGGDSITDHLIYSVHKDANDNQMKHGCTD